MTQKRLNRKRLLIIISCICISIIGAGIFAVMFAKSNNTMQGVKVQSVIGTERNLLSTEEYASEDVVRAEKEQEYQLIPVQYFMTGQRKIWLGLSEISFFWGGVDFDA